MLRKKNAKKSSAHRRALLLVLAGALSPGAQAIDVPLYIQVTIHERPCLVNNGDTKEIDFGTVMLSDVEQGNVAQPLPFVLDCGATPPPEVNLWIQSQPSNFDLSLLGTTQRGLGIAIEDGQGRHFSPHVYHTLSFTKPPVLQAVLRADTRYPPAEGVFRASATFLVTYY